MKKLILSAFLAIVVSSNAHAGLILAEGMFPSWWTDSIGIACAGTNCGKFDGQK
jgi:hypothetical protein